MRVFISYSAKDGKDFAKRLNDTLSKRGHDSFFADHDILRSQGIWEVIPKQCLSRDVAIFVITPSFKESKGQKEEYLLVVGDHLERMALKSQKVEYGDVFDFYPCLKSYKAEVFDESTFDSVCEKIAADLVRLQDLKNASLQSREKYKDDFLPELSTEGLDIKEVANCLRHLHESFDEETIVPYVCRVVVEKDSFSKGFMTIGFNNLLPKEWFLPKEKQETVVVTDFMFREFGREIALAERSHLQGNILANSDVPKAKIDFSPQGIASVVEQMRGRSAEPDLIFPTIEQYIEMIGWKGNAHVEYHNVHSGRVLNATLIIDKSELQIITPLGRITQKAIILSKSSIRWHARVHPKYGALFTALGRSQLYPEKFAQLTAFVSAKCEMDPNGITVIN
jgi:hypothetical protein